MWESNEGPLGRIKGNLWRKLKWGYGGSNPQPPNALAKKLKNRMGLEPKPFGQFKRKPSRKFKVQC